MSDISSYLLSGINFLVKNDKQKDNPHFLCNGPSKLCIAMNVRKDNCNKLDLCDNEMLWIEDDPEFNLEEYKVVKTARIGIDRVDPEWALKPLRFYLLGHPCVSKRNKQTEKEFINS